MPKQTDTVGIDLGFENLMHCIYGHSGHSCRAGHTSFTSWKKQLSQVFRTLKTAIRKNMTGDDRHKERLMARLDHATITIHEAKSSYELSPKLLSFLLEIAFELLGRLPRNSKRRKANHNLITDLSDYRTLNYARTAKQKTKQVTDYAFARADSRDEPKFEDLIYKLKRDFSNDSDKFLSWLRVEHRDFHDRFF
jgi:hypothetical protein